MKRLVIGIIICVIFTACTTTKEEVKSAVKPGVMPEEYFDYYILQDGVSRGISNHEITLEKAPFTLVIIMKEPIGVLTNFSTISLLYDGILKNLTISEILENADAYMGMAEYERNPDEEIFIHDVYPHYLYYATDMEHRFSTVEYRDGLYYCYRKISNYRYNDTMDVVKPIHELDVDTLYISMVYHTWTDDYDRIYKQHDTFKINFK